MTSPLDNFQPPCRSCRWSPSCAALTPAEAPAIGDAIVEAGFRLLEVPLNSPQPLASIALLLRAFPTRWSAPAPCSSQQVREVHAAGGELIVSPNFNAEVVAEAARLGLVCLPGVMTPTEAFGALAAGADGLKLFPAELASPAVVKALLAVLPAGTPLMPVGGITPSNMAVWRAAARPVSASARRSTSPARRPWCRGREDFVAACTGPRLKSA